MATSIVGAGNVGMALAKAFTRIGERVGAALDIARSVEDWKGKVLVDAPNPLVAGLAGLTVAFARLKR